MLKLSPEKVLSHSTNLTEKLIGQEYLVIDNSSKVRHVFLFTLQSVLKLCIDLYFQKNKKRQEG